MAHMEIESQKSPIRELFLIKKRVMNGVIKAESLFFEGLVSLPWFPWLLSPLKASGLTELLLGDSPGQPTATSMKSGTAPRIPALTGSHNGEEGVRDSGEWRPGGNCCWNGRGPRSSAHPPALAPVCSAPHFPGLPRPWFLMLDPQGL